uniref:Uncharacterized protein n=1 Tax=Anguilla anguilla TaxID=7936 RepID=A0A0E9VU92_ANGAN
MDQLCGIPAGIPVSAIDTSLHVPVFQAGPLPPLSRN